MSHEMIQVIILVKYLRQSHEMIKVKHKCLLTTVNKKKDKSKHSHVITWFRNRITVWSLLHEPVLIYESSRGSVFESLVHRIICKHESESPATGPDLTRQVWIIAPDR